MCVSWHVFVCVCMCVSVCVCALVCLSNCSDVPAVILIDWFSQKCMSFLFTS